MVETAKDELAELGREISRFILQAVRSDPTGAVGDQLRTSLADAVQPKVQALLDLVKDERARTREEIEALQADVRAMVAVRDDLAANVIQTNRELAQLNAEVRQLTKALRREGLPVAPVFGDAGAIDAGAATNDDLGGWRAKPRASWLERNWRLLAAVGAFVVVALGAGLLLWATTRPSEIPAGGAKDRPLQGQSAASPEAGWARIVDGQRLAADANVPGARESLARLCGDDTQGDCPTFAARFAAKAEDVPWREEVARLAALAVAGRNGCDTAPEGVEGGPPAQGEQLRCLLSEAARE